MGAVEVHRKGGIHCCKYVAEVAEFDPATVLQGEAGDQLYVIPVHELYHQITCLSTGLQDLRHSICFYELKHSCHKVPACIPNNANEHSLFCYQQDVQWSTQQLRGIRVCAAT